MKVDKRQMKSAARLYAVQALFQMEVSGQTVEAVTREFETHRFGATYEEGEFAAVDLKVDGIQRGSRRLVIDLGDILETDHGPRTLQDVDGYGPVLLPARGLSSRGSRAPASRLYARAAADPAECGGVSQD